MHTTLEPPAQPLWRAILFRFAFVYWALIILVLCANEDTGLIWFGKLVGPVWNPIVVWVGKSVLGISYELHPGVNGSGDKTTDWIGVLIAAAAAALATIMWSALAGRARHPRLRALLRVLVRYTLAFGLLGYGSGKLFCLQFSTPGAARLIQPYGESSPMGLLWTFMGASSVYQFVAGAAETLGAVLLLFRRTTMLGALVLAGVLLNVALLNFCYDVPVKINAVHYLGMAIYLLLPELRRLADVVLFNRATQPRAPDPISPSRRWRIARVIVKYGLIGLMVAQNAQAIVHWRNVRAASAWYTGYWNVSTFSRDGQDVPALITDATRWRRVRFQGGGDTLYVRWRFMDDAYGDLYTAVVDDKRQTFTLTPWNVDTSKPPTGTVTLHYVHATPDQLTLEGKVGAATLVIQLDRFDAGKMLLVSRGFHWINEVPFNR